MPMVIGPTRPINIVILRSSFPNQLRLEVIPVDNPVFPSADALSKTRGRNGIFSVRLMTRTSVIITRVNRKNIEKDLRMFSSVILLSKKLLSLCPTNCDLIAKKMVPRVVVLIPPPVLPGEAPMSINKIIINKELAVISPIFIVLKPSVVDADMA